MTLTEQLEYINEDIQSSMAGADWSINMLTEKDVRDWGLNENTTEDELKEMAAEFINYAHTAMCENKNAWRYEY